MTTLTITRRLPARAVRPRVVILTLLIAAGVLVPLIVMSFLGPSPSYEYEIRGTVKSASDGTPLSGVLVALRLNPLGRATKSASETPRGWELSKADGSFLVRTEINEYGFSHLPRWVLHLTKPGYEETLMDISQHGAPKSGSSPFLIAVAAHLRPSASDAAPRHGN
jgi:hypothetical protein